MGEEYSPHGEGRKEEVLLLEYKNVLQNIAAQTGHLISLVTVSVRIWGRTQLGSLLGL